MTIYECLGIEKYLIDETIPTDLIIENIDSDDLRCDAHVYFKDIFHVSIRASLNRGNHFMQVIEVELNRADHISEISALIQKAIRYQVLFVFVFEERYLILRRSFNLTISSEHVYTDHASFSTDWIYKENLEDEFVAMFDTAEIVNCYDEDYVLSFEPKQTPSDNGDHRYFDDVIKNAVSLNNAVIDSDVVSLRFLLDWWQLHISGLRVNIFDVLDKVRQVQAYQMIGDYLFVEKEVVSYAISELEESQYILSLGHTGRTPMYYFRELEKPSTFIDDDNLTSFILYSDICFDNDDESIFDIEQECNLVFYDYESEKALKKKNKYLHREQIRRNLFQSMELPPLLAKSEEFELGHRIEKGDINARDTLIISNIRLVVNIAGSYVASEMDYEDLIQEGIIGLIRAVEEYNRWYDNKFATYATYWIKQSIQRAIENKSHLIRLPVHFQETIKSVKKAHEELLVTLCKTPSPKDIGTVLNISPQVVQNALVYSENPIIYDEPISNNSDTILSLFVDEEAKTINEHIEEIVKSKQIQAALSTLSPKEQLVLKLRFGFFDGTPKNLEEVANEFCVTRERIRQIEAVALRKLRRPSCSKYLHKNVL